MKKPIKDVSGLMKSSLYFLVLILLATFVFKTALSRIGWQREELKADKAKELVLRQKENVLRDFQPEVMSWADLSSLALPEKDATLVVISQIKRLALEKGVLIKNVKIEGVLGSKKDLFRAKLKIEASGLFSQLTDFSASLKNLLPLTAVDKVRIVQEPEMAKAEIVLAVFWAPFPTKLPSIVDPVVELSAEEIDLLSDLNTFNPPLFIELSPSSPSLRINPFQ
jgi:Tfp pilus assembly protein PilO